MNTEIKYTDLVDEVREQLELGVEYYAQQPGEPEWFGLIEPAGGIALSARMGSSPYNEWAGFASRASALEWLWRLRGDRLHDYAAFPGGETYSADDVEWDGTTYDPTVPPGTKPADLADMFQAQSRF